jgi:hypothetical protein
MLHRTTAGALVCLQEHTNSSSWDSNGRSVLCKDIDTGLELTRFLVNTFLCMFTHTYFTQQWSSL